MPVLVLDVDEAEAAKLLALHDPLAAMAGKDEEILADLIAEVETDNAAVRELLDRLIKEPEMPGDADASGGESREVGVGEVYQVVVECRDEADQQAVYERLNGEGYKCKLLTL